MQVPFDDVTAQPDPRPARTPFETVQRRDRTDARRQPGGGEGWACPAPALSAPCWPATCWAGGSGGPRPELRGARRGVAALPAARLALAAGRRARLAVGYGVAAIGGLLAVLAAQVQSLSLLLLGTALFGGGTTAGLQARYAATDLAPAERRGRALSVVVWATTIGGVVGPNLVGPAGWLGEQLGIERLAGPFLVGAVMLAVGALVVATGLRPDPLLVARSLHAEHADRPTRRHGVLRSGLGATVRSPRALLGMTAVVVAHTVMVSVMVMTPIHMDHGHASLEIIGFVLSVHIAGMFAFSPVMGWLADQVGRIPVVAFGGVALLAAVSTVGHVDRRAFGRADRRAVPARPRVVGVPGRGFDAAHRGRADRGPAGRSGVVRPADGARRGRGRCPGRRGGRDAGIRVAERGGGAAGGRAPPRDGKPGRSFGSVHGRDRLWVGGATQSLPPRVAPALAWSGPGMSGSFEHQFGLRSTGDLGTRAPSTAHVAPLRDCRNRCVASEVMTRRPQGRAAARGPQVASMAVPADRDKALETAITQIERAAGKGR